MIDVVINKIDDELVNTFKEVDNWFGADDSLVGFNPNDGGWSIRKILEHISLTNHFLLILIRKGARKALEVSVKHEFSDLLANYDLDWTRLKQIAEHKSFIWNRPEHMERRNRRS